jgi:AcrR family transcriptional regulator
MSPANIYRFFTTKGEINEAVAGRLLAEVETGLQKIGRSPRSGSARLRELILKIEKENVQRFRSDRKLHDLLERAYDEHWPILATHNNALDEALVQVISDGMSAGEFRQGCAKTAAVLVRNACLRFFHPKFVMECAQTSEPTVDQMVDFCLAALAK